MLNFLFRLFEEETPATDWTTYLFLGLLAVMIVFMFVMPNRRNKKRAQEMMNTLKVGSKVTTIGGIIGKVIEINEAENSLVIATGSEENPSLMRFTKNAIYYIFPDETETETKNEAEYNVIEAPKSKKK